MAEPPPAEDFTRDALLGGRVSLMQPRAGYRVAIDPVLLAAAVAAAPGQAALDLGCGVGAAALCLAARVADVKVTGIERESDLALLARRNVELNGRADRLTIVEADLFARHEPLPHGGFDEVLVNPPFLEAMTVDAPPNPVKARATIESNANLNDWVTAALKFTRARGWVTLIHRADRLAALLATLDGRAGDIAVFPFWPRAGEPARRVIARARKGSRGPLRLLPGLLLHDADGRYTSAAEAVLRDGAALDLRPS